MGIDIFLLIMWVNRFRFLNQMIHFDNVTEQSRFLRKLEDNLYTIWSIFDDFVCFCKKYYSNGLLVTVDEMLPNFRRRWSFWLFMLKKPEKYGIKFYACSNARTYYIFFDTKTTTVVQRIVAISQLTIFIYLCPDNLLLKRLTLVGTMKKDKKEILSLPKTKKGL